MPTVSADPARLLVLAGGVHQQHLRLSGSRARLSPLVARVTARSTLPIPIPAIDPLLGDLDRALRSTTSRAEEVARRLLSVDGSVRVPLPGGGHAEVPLSLALLAHDHPAALLAAPDGPEGVLGLLGAFAAGAGQWAGRHRGVLPVLLAARDRGADAAAIRDALRAAAGLAVKGSAVQRLLGARAGLALQVVSLGADLRAVQRQGNPLRALARHGTDYMADLNRVTFDATAIAFTRSPSPATGTAVALSGASWVEWELADDRLRTARAVAAAALRGQDAARGAAVHGTDLATDGAVAAARALEHGAGLAPPGTAGAVAVGAAAVDRAAATADRALDRATDGARRRAGGAVDGAGRVARGALEAGADAIDEGLERLGGLVR